jgi:hypothetical protein
MVWHPVAELPPEGVPIIIIGKTGYRAPHDRLVISGRFEPEYRPLAPWRTSQNDALSDYGYTPTHWRLMSAHDGFWPETS